MSDEIMKRMETAGLAFNRLSPPVKRQGFLRRQLQAEATLSQLIFDVTVGMILPVLCLVFDPLVFRSGGLFGAPLFGGYQFFAYGLIAIEIVALGVWLAAGKRAGEWCGVLGGAMLAGAFFSACIGMLLLPFSVIGLALGIGVLGFTPFVTAFIYWRNARRALKAASAQMSRAALCVTLALGAAVPFGAPLFAHWRIQRMIERSLPEVLGGDGARAAAAVRRLSYVSPFVTGEFDEMVSAYGRETDPARKERLARMYREMTGADIQTRMYLLND
ncbi:MAG TPA: hypothetical protein VF527_17480 [Pyrinomonadaceae bacterium]|jgi:hypothetical protein